MLIRTHLAAAFFVGVFLMKYFENNFLFLGIILIATFLPDIDSRFSKLGKRKIFRPLQFLFGHRKIFHSLLFLGLVLIPVYFISGDIFYGFAFGYGLHLFIDCFSVQGTRPFYPFEFKISGFVKTGSFFETIIFYGFLFWDLILIIRYFVIV